MLIREREAGGAVVCSACAGAFIIAAAGLANQRTVTTHWGLADQFKACFPSIDLKAEEILINQNYVITAGGMMSWIDLGLELIKLGFTDEIMRQVGKNLVIDTAPREQRFYQQFRPDMSHGDSLILDIQRQMQDRFRSNLKINDLATEHHISERTLLRRFQKAVGFKPREYISRLRIQSCCDLLERTQDSFETIAFSVGYEDVSACRKAFRGIMGLSPSAFRERFVENSPNP